MKALLKAVAIAAAMSGAATFASAPARADSFSFSVGVPGVAFSYGTGGYCDRWGCPEDYWDYPVYYGPVYYGGTWFRGPVYYRLIDGDYWYWVHDGWHRNGWHGPRPHWWGHYRYGPALGYGYYSGHGFRHDRDPYWRGAIRHDRREFRRDRREDRREFRHERRHDRREDWRDRHHR